MADQSREPIFSPPSPADIRAQRTRRWFTAASVAGGLALVALAGMAVADAPAQPRSGGASSGKVAGSDSNGPRKLDLYDAAITDFDISITTTGDLRARNQVELRSNVEQETTIIEIIPEGVNVKKGDVLVRLNAESTQTRLDEESLYLESARAAVVEANEAHAIQLSENDSATRAATLKLALAQLSLEQWMQGEVKSKQQELTHSVDTSEKDVERLEDKVDKSESLFAAGYYSKDQLQQDQLELERAVAANDKATLARDIYWEYEYPKEQKQKMSDVEESAAEVDRVGRLNASRMVSKEADRKNKQQALAIREQKFNKLKDQLEAATVHAPSDGLVVYASSIDGGRWGDDSGPLQVGSKVYPQQGLIVLPDTSEMLAHVKVHESIAGRVRKGMPCSLKIDAAGDARFTGRVDSVGVLAEQTSRWMDPTLREYTVKIIIDKPADGTTALRPSMRCEAEITLGRADDALTVPIQSVFSEGLLRYVHVASDNGRYARRPVLVGQRSDRFAEIKVGLNEGERVLLRKPDPSELLDKGTASWKLSELAIVGLEINASGDIVPTAAAMAARGQSGEGGRPGAEGATGGKRGSRTGGGKPASDSSSKPQTTNPAPATADPAKPAAAAETSEHEAAATPNGDADHSSAASPAPTPAAPAELAK